MIERAYHLCDGDIIKDDYTQYNIKSLDNRQCNKKIMPLAEVERQCILKALSYCEGNIVKAAEMLKISRATIYRKIKKYEIEGFEVFQNDTKKIDSQNATY
jgi:transcriptional regulator of acetoin/glycerol metabolism